MNKWIDKWQIKKNTGTKVQKWVQLIEKKEKKKEKEKAVQCDKKKKSNNIKYQSNEPALTVITESLEN